MHTACSTLLSATLQSKIPAGNQLIDENMKFYNDYFQGLRFFAPSFDGIHLNGLALDGIHSWIHATSVDLDENKQHKLYVTLTCMFLSGEATCIDALIITLCKSLSPS